MGGDGSFWYETTVTDDNVSEGDMVLALPADEASRAACAAILSAIATQNGGFALKSSTPPDAAIHLLYLVCRAAEEEEAM